jgi:glycosyltransferase involved in cell wall biosynthesis
MNVILLTEYLTDIGGAEHEVANFVKIFPKAPIYCLLYEKHQPCLLDEKKIVESSFGRRLPKIMKKNRRFLLPILPSIIESMVVPSNTDLVVSISHSFAKGLILPPRTKHLCYCLSPARFLWDWGHKYIQTQNRGWLLSNIAKWQQYRLRQWDFTAAQRVDKFIAITKTVQSRIWKFYRRRSDVVYPGLDISKFTKYALNHKSDDFEIWNPKLKGKYWLVVSQLSAYKNVELIIKTFNKIKLPLVVIGGGDQEKYLRKIAKPNIHFLGRISNDDVVRYYQNCYTVIVPCEEDFGLVAIEAMACGKPVLALKKGGALETCVEHQTGEFFEKENDEKSLINGINKIRKAYQTYKPELIKKNAAKYSYQNFEQGIRRHAEAITQ